MGRLPTAQPSVAVTIEIETRSAFVGLLALFQPRPFQCSMVPWSPTAQASVGERAATACSVACWQGSRLPSSQHSQAAPFGVGLGAGGPLDGGAGGRKKISARKVG